MAITRRRFLQGSLATTAAAAAPLSLTSRVYGANEQLRVGVIGLGNRGSNIQWGAGHVQMFHKQPGVRVTGICDPDKERLAISRKWLEDQGEKPKAVTDLRRLIDDPDIDVIVVATPNHWHVLASLWALQADKNVYCEKPISHNYLEGRKLIAMAERSGRVVAGGTQHRSDVMAPKVKAFLDKKPLGELQWVRLNRYGRRSSIGRRQSPLQPPESVNYNLWLGPAQDEHIMRDQFHYDWHWVWNTGNGEMGNWGVHILDDLRHLIFRDEVVLPTRCVSGGGRFVWDDAGQTPNTQFTYYETTAGVPVILDIHNLPFEEGAERNDIYRRRSTRALMVAEYENGYMTFDRGGAVAYDSDGETVESFDGDGGEAHVPNFIEAVRDRDQSKLAAPIEQSHYSSSWCLLGNLSYRLGEPYNRDRALSRVSGFEPWQRVLETTHQHLEANGVDPDQAEISLGATVEIDPETLDLAGESDNAETRQLFYGQQRGYRSPFVLPPA